MVVNVGDVIETREGGSVVVLKYNSCKDIVIQHQDTHGYVCSVRSEQLITGKIKNPYYPSVLGVGYVGVGKYKTKVNKVRTPEYEAWKGMLRRAYCEKRSVKHPSYEGVTVDERWHNFQVFAEWWNNEPNSGRKGFALDKDLRIFGNKQYSPEACSYVPTRINNLLTDSARIRGDYPQGVTAYKNCYAARLKMNTGKHVMIGLYNSVDEAYNAYKYAKSDYVKQVAKEYRSVLHPEVYHNLLTWELV